MSKDLDLRGIPEGIPEDGILTSRPGHYMGFSRATKLFVAYEQDVLQGGNCLANAMYSAGMQPDQFRHATYDEVLARFHQPIADIWVAWKAIMEWRDHVLEKTK